jgi:hypothetical protein
MTEERVAGLEGGRSLQTPEVDIRVGGGGIGVMKEPRYLALVKGGSGESKEFGSGVD